MFPGVLRVTGLLLGSWGALTACVRERTLFDQSAADGGDAGATSSGLGSGKAGIGGKGPGAPGVPWDATSCVAALSQGKLGDACIGAFKCSASSSCCQSAALCEGGQLSLKSSCDECVASCTGDADCGLGRVCEAYECRDCRSGACPPSWLSVTRNGCPVCVPPSACKSAKDPSCGEGRACVAGLTCLPGCKGDPACCFGNQCAPIACETPELGDCLVVGCPAGSTCNVVAEAAACSCDAVNGKWSCDEPPTNTCVPDDKL
jgi:hypothetical protein